MRLAHERELDAICNLYVDDPWLWLGKSKHDPTARWYYADRLRREELCYIALVDGQVAHVNWTCSAWGDALPGQPIRLRPGEICTTDALTPAPFRGKGMHMLVLGTMLNDARERGARHAYTLGSLDRPAAVKGLHAFGWREIGRIVYFVPRGFDRPLLLSRSGKTDVLFRPRVQSVCSLQRH